MTWRKGLLRIWVVGTAIWIAATVGLVLQYAAEAPRVPGILVPERVFEASKVVRAAKLYAEYWYYLLIRPDVAAEARKILSDPCVSWPERERYEAEVVKAE